MPDTSELRRTSHSREELQAQLERWLRTRLGDAARPTVSGIGSGANGLSSDTALFTATWDEDGERSAHELVARLAPGAADVPVFPSYDLGRQADVIREVGQRSSVPVPRVYWYEDDPSHLGTPFFVMSKVDGIVPPDVMPYPFGDNWLFDASPDDQERLQRASVQVLADLHAIDDDDAFRFLAFDDAGDTALRRHVAHTRAWYEFVAADAGRSPLIERGFTWLDDHWPDNGDGWDTVISWGDARIGNVLYRDFEPVAVLDWEMVGLGPRELDLAWMTYSHRVFEDIAAQLALPGMPHFLRAVDVLADYERATGYTVRSFDWFGTYAAVQWAIVFVRVARRLVHFGEQEMAASVDDLITNRDPLTRMLDGSYWDEDR